MPDLSRERRDRARQSLDQLVTFRVATGGDYNDDGEYEPVMTEWMAWGRRDDADIDTAYELGPGGFRETGEVKLIVRYDSRLEPGVRNTFTIGETFRITLVEEVGRRRYMRLMGARSS